MSSSFNLVASSIIFFWQYYISQSINFVLLNHYLSENLVLQLLVVRYFISDFSLIVTLTYAHPLLRFSVHLLGISAISFYV